MRSLCLVSISALTLLVAACGDDDDDDDDVADGSSSSDGSAGDSAGSDSASPLDGAPDASPFCTTWSLVSVPAQMLENIDPMPPNPERTLRIRSHYTRTACHQRAMPLVVYSVRSREILIGMRLWRAEGVDCAEADQPDSRLVDIRPPLEGVWTVRDAEDAGVSILIDVSPPPAGSCGMPPGAACVRDCDCTGVGEKCLGAYGFGGPFLGCAASCEVDHDCAAGICLSVADGHESTCQTADQCGAGDPCPSGYDCVAGACEASFELGAATRVACTCDADCTPPLSCVEPDGDGTRRCELRCPTGSARWCSSGHWCAEAADDISGLAETGAVCGWVGD